MPNLTPTPRISGLYLVLATLFVTLLVTSNVIAVKIIEIGGRILPAAIVLFPVTYIIGDVLTEKRAKTSNNVIFIFIFNH